MEKELETHRQLISKVLLEKVFPLLQLPAFTVLEMERIHSFANINYKVVTDQGSYMVKIPKKFAEWQSPINPLEHVALTDQIIRDNRFGPREFYHDDSCRIFEYLESEIITLEESVT